MSQKNRLTYICDAGKNKWGIALALFICSCGNFTITRKDRNSKKIKSCGCLRKEIAKQNIKNAIKLQTKHNLSYHPLYRIWAGMKRRCYNSKDRSYKNYGGREIKICDEWKNNLQEFYNWAIDNGWIKGLQIDRIDNNKNYSPENCHFTTSYRNNLNKRLLKSTNTSGYKGVCWHKLHNKWVAYISIHKKIKWLSYFKSLKLAALRYDVEAYLADNRPRNFIENV